jgi:WD40 repeat protein
VPTRNAEAVWEGDLKGGKGTILNRSAVRSPSMRAVCVVLTLAACGVLPAADAPRTITAGKRPAHLTFSPDGKSLAVASGESLTLHDPATDKEKLTLAGHTWPVHSVAFSPDGKLLASGAGGFRDGKRGGEVRVWDVATGKVKHNPAWWEGGDVNEVTFSPDGKWVAAGGLKGLRVWNAATGKLQKEIETNAAILALAYSPDGKTLAAGAFTGFAHLWDTATWKETMLKGHKSEVRAVAYSPDGKTLVTGGVGEFKVWNASGELRQTVKHPDTVWAVVFTPDGKQVAVGSGEPRADLKGAVGVWNPADWSEKHRWAGDGGMVGSVAFSPDGKLLAAGRYSGAVEIRDPAVK